MPGGRYPKPDLTPVELERAEDLVGQRGWGKGLEGAAREVSRMRGAQDVVSPALQRKRRVSARWLGRQLEAARTTAKLLASNSADIPRRRQNANPGKTRGASKATKSRQNPGARDDSGPRMERGRKGATFSKKRLEAAAVQRRPSS